MSNHIALRDAWGVVYTPENDDMPKMYLTDHKGTFWINHDHQVFSTSKSHLMHDLVHLIRNKQLFKIKQTIYENGEEGGEMQIAIKPKSSDKIMVDGKVLDKERVIDNGRCTIRIDSRDLDLVFEAFCDLSQDHRLYEVEDRYRLISILGRGGYGLVYKGLNMNSEDFCAVKTEVRRTQNDLQLEYSMLCNAKHANVIRAVDFMRVDQNNFLMTELAEGGSLFSRVRRRGKVSEEASRHIFRQLFAGMQFLHGRDIVHRDMKPENIVLTSATNDLCQAKIIDFGLSSRGSDTKRMESIVGALRYMSPEMLSKKVLRSKRPVDDRVDIWGLGLCLFIALTTTVPFEYDQDLEVYRDRMLGNEIKTYLSSYKCLSDPTKVVIERSLTINASNRPPIDFFVTYNW